MGVCDGRTVAKRRRTNGEAAGGYRVASCEVCRVSIYKYQEGAAGTRNISVYGNKIVKQKESWTNICI